MTRSANILLVAFIVVFTARELHDLGSACGMSSDKGFHRWFTQELQVESGTVTKTSDASSSTNDAASDSTPPPPLSASNSHFHAAAVFAYNRIVSQDNQAGDEPQRQQARAKFNTSTWTKSLQGGLTKEDRDMLGRVYGNASSVFEFGLGESTYIANHVEVPRYTGIDSDATWISMVRNNVSSSYRFYFADIGMTKSWGYPKAKLNKAAYNYQVVPLLGEPYAFDVYMVDGRYRVGCLLMSFLHASSGSRQNAGDSGASHLNSSSTVLVHDCDRRAYHVADHLLDLVEFSGMKLCAYRRKHNTTDEQLYTLWRSKFHDIF